MEIHFVEHQDLEARRTVIAAYTMVGGRKIYSRMIISWENYHQNYIDAAYNMIKDEVRSRALNEMRVQQIYDSPARHVECTYMMDDQFVSSERRLVVKPPAKKIHNWKEEGF